MVINIISVFCLALKYGVMLRPRIDTKMNIFKLRTIPAAVALLAAITGSVNFRQS